LVDSRPWESDHRLIGGLPGRGDGGVDLRLLLRALLGGLDGTGG
jgi:hypothetical protein